MSRLEKIGTFYSRMKALLNAGVVKAEFRPLWMDIYEAHPPKYEPRWDRVIEGSDEPLPQILYREDKVRAQFYRQFGDRHEPINLHDSGDQLLSQRFIEKFDEVAKGEDFKQDFVSTIDALELEGLNLRQLDKEAAVVDGRKVFSEGKDGPKIRSGREATQETPIKFSFQELFSETDEEKPK